MTSLVVSTAFELKDKRSVNFQNYPDINIFKNVHAIVSESWLVDRTEQVQLPFKTQVLKENKLPSFRGLSNLDLLECCTKRAKEIISRNKKIYLMWSGGIDSTLMLVSFLLINAEKDQIVVACNNESIKENYNFYKNHIRENFTLISSEELMQKMKYQNLDELVLSGEQGDLLYGQDFGSSIFDVYGGDKLTESPTRDNIVPFLILKGMTEQSANCWYDIFSQGTKNSPREIKTIYDFSWWAGFNWRWQWSIEKVRMRSNLDLDLHTFFSSPQMQYWSVNHKQLPIKQKTDFKYEYKKIIYNYTMDENIFQKIKNPSTTLYYNANAYAAIDSNNVRIKANNLRLMDYYQKDNFITDWLA